MQGPPLLSPRAPGLELLLCPQRGLPGDTPAAGGQLQGCLRVGWGWCCSPCSSCWGLLAPGTAPALCPLLGTGAGLLPKVVARHGSPAAPGSAAAAPRPARPPGPRMPGDVAVPPCSCGVGTAATAPGASCAWGLCEGGGLLAGPPGSGTRTSAGSAFASSWSHCWACLCLAWAASRQQGPGKALALPKPNPLYRGLPWASREPGTAPAGAEPVSAPSMGGMGPVSHGHPSPSPGLLLQGWTQPQSGLGSGGHRESPALAAGSWEGAGGRAAAPTSPQPGAGEGSRTAHNPVPTPRHSPAWHGPAGQRCHVQGQGHTGPPGGAGAVCRC